MQKGDVRVCVRWLVADIYFLSLRCVYVRHRCKAGSADELAGGGGGEELARTTTTNTAGFVVLRCG